MEEFFQCVIPSYFFDEIVTHACLSDLEISYLLSPLKNDIEMNLKFEKRPFSTFDKNTPFQIIHWEKPKTIPGLDEAKILHTFNSNNKDLLKNVGLLSFYRSEEIHYLMRALIEARLYLDHRLENMKI